MKKIAIVVFVLAILVVGTAVAVDPINATVETQGISSTTGVVVLGGMTNMETVVWTQDNQDLRNNPPLNEWADEIGWVPPFFIPERQAVMFYTEAILADNGYAEFNEMQALDTGNKVANQDNFKSTEQFDYVAFTDAMGRATTSESILLDLASQGSDAANRFICPFATGDNGYIPAYCNVYEMGSSFSGSQVSIITQADENHIAKSADVPTQIAYSVGLSGTGSVAAWINAHVMEGRTGNVFPVDVWVLAPWWEGPIPATLTTFYNPDTGDGSWFTGGNGLNGFMQGVDLVYKEKTTASGVIESFSKSMSVQDAVRRL
ncbi:MAG: hypothetical protein MUC66_08305 [Methanolinea sp.]|jgi:hypothetical protein|nr:hypothetical protein [Methanolinea sp.]